MGRDEIPFGPGVAIFKYGYWFKRGFCVKACLRAMGAEVAGANWDWPPRDVA